MRRELGIEGRLGDFLDNMDRARRTLEKLPDATENIAALAQAWAQGEVDLSKNPGLANSAKKSGAAKPIAWAGLGALAAAGGIWVVSQF